MITNIQDLQSIWSKFLIEADLNQSQQERARELLIEVEKVVKQQEHLIWAFRAIVKHLQSPSPIVPDRDAQSETEENI